MPEGSSESITILQTMKRKLRDKLPAYPKVDEERPSVDYLLFKEHGEKRIGTDNLPSPYCTILMVCSAEGCIQCILRPDFDEVKIDICLTEVVNFYNHFLRDTPEHPNRPQQFLIHFYSKDESKHISNHAVPVFGTLRALKTMRGKTLPLWRCTYEANENDGTFRFWGESLDLRDGGEYLPVIYMAKDNDLKFIATTMLIQGESRFTWDAKPRELVTASGYPL